MFYPSRCPSVGGALAYWAMLADHEGFGGVNDAHRQCIAIGLSAGGARNGDLSTLLLPAQGGGVSFDIVPPPARGRR